MRACKLALLLLVLTPALAAAQELAPGRILKVGAERGLWWPVATADMLRAEHLLVPKLQLQLADHEALVATLKERLAEKDLTIAGLKQSGSLSEARAQVSELAIDAALKGQLMTERNLTACESRARAWYRHPALWFAAGAVVAAGVTGAAFALTN
jgi:hypothetical protein